MMLSAPGRSPPPPRIAKSERTKNRILEAGVRAIAQLGFEKATVSTLARRAGVSRPLVVHYFPTKEDLLGAIVGYVQERARGRVAEGDPESGSAWERLDAYFEANLRWATEYPHHLNLWMLFLYRASFSRRWGGVNLRMIEEGTGRVESIVARGVETGEFEAPEPKAAALLLHRALYGILSTYVVKALAEETPRNLACLKAESRRLLAPRR
jgi:TetR/AcrR family transcriptional regulator, fatty acid metabolism regulator protein